MVSRKKLATILIVFSSLWMLLSQILLGAVQLENRIFTRSSLMTESIVAHRPVLNLSMYRTVKEENKMNTPSVNLTLENLSVKALYIKQTSSFSSSLRKKIVEDIAVQRVEAVENPRVQVAETVEKPAEKNNGVEAKNSSSSATSEKGTPVLTFYLHGELSARLASYAIGAAYAKRHGYDFRAFWEKDDNCSLLAEDIFGTTGNGSRAITSVPAGDSPPTFAECGQDLTECLRANQSIAYRGLYRHLPTLHDKHSFRSEARSALKMLSLNQKWAQHYIPIAGAPREYVMVLFQSESDRGLETIVEATRFATPLIDSTARAMLQPNGTELIVFVLTSHQTVLDAMKTFYRREVQQFLFLNMKFPTTYTWMSAMWRALGLVPNFRVKHVIGSSPTLLAPSLVALLPPSAKYTAVRCVARLSPPIRVLESKDRGALYILDGSKKDVRMVGTTTLHATIDSARPDDFFIQELGRSVESMSRSHNGTDGGPLRVAVFSDRTLLASTREKISHLLPLNATHTLGDYEVALAVASRGSTSLMPKRIAKFKHMAQSPFEVTLYLDTDTVVCGSLWPCFSLLENSEFDMMLGKEFGPKSWNSGVILYRRSAAMEVFLRLWEHLYMFDCVLPGVKNQDQCALLTAMELLPSLKVGLLPAKCHMLLFNENWEQASKSTWQSLHSQVIPKGEVARLLHTRLFNRTFYQSPELCEFVNGDMQRDRVLGFHEKWIPRMYFDAKDCQTNTMQGCNKVLFSSP